MGYKQDYLINRFFSRNTMRNLIQNKKDPVFEYVSRNGNVSSSNLSVIQNTYIQLSKFYRNEYFYKNSFDWRAIKAQDVSQLDLTKIPSSFAVKVMKLELVDI